MSKKLSWYGKYLLTLEEALTIKDIMNLRGVGQPKALQIRQLAINYCLLNNLTVAGKKTPTVAVLEVTGHNQEYYYNQMIKEAEVNRIVNMRGDLNYVSA